MSKKPVVIFGEASETDSEDDVSNSTIPINMTASIQGAIITGEDSESDEESSVSSAVSVKTPPIKQEKTESSGQGQNDSLLHRKLRECNNNLYNNIESFCDNIASQAGKNLSSIDQQLLRSQLTLHAAVASLRSLNDYSHSFNNKLQSTLSSNFISNISYNYRS